MSEYVASMIIVIAFLTGLITGHYSTANACMTGATTQLIEVNK